MQFLILGYEFHPYTLSVGQGVANRIQFRVHAAYISLK